MKLLSRVSALAAIFGALVCAAPMASAVTNLGTLGGSYKLFSSTYNQPTPSFTDYYTFRIADSGLVAGGTLELDFGDLLNLNISNISLSGGTIAGSSLIDLNPNDGFAFTGLGIGSYVMSISGSVTGLLGGTYIGGIHAVAATVAAPVPEPEHYAMALLGIAGVGAMVRRARAK